MLRVSAPGRICLFGEHQDFLGLAVVAAAIDRRIYIEGTPRTDRVLHMDMPDIGQSDEIDLAMPVEYTRKRDYLRSCVNVLLRTGWAIPQGFDCTMRSTIPINAGVSSSSAMIVAWLTFLLNTAGWGDRYTRQELASLAHQAEVVEFGEPGGMMDHFASAMGNLIWVDTRPPFQADYLNVKLEGFVLGDSQQKKDTVGVLGSSRSDVNEGIKLLEEWFPGFDLQSTPADEVMPLVDKLPEHISKRVRANLINRDIRIEAVETFRTGKVDPVRLGELLTLHHEQLRDGIGVSTEKMDRMCAASLEAGALGAKMNGSGGGGCMFAYAPGRQDEVCAAIEGVGGKAYKVIVDSGARVEP
jgi:galactokinase